MKCFNFVCTLIVVLLSMLTLGFGQGGIPPFSTQQTKQFDSIDLANDNILVAVPVRSKAGAIPLSFSLTANSNMRNAGSSWVSSIPSPPGELLSLQSPVSAGVYPVQTQLNYVCPDNSYTNLYTGFYVIDKTGARHDFVGGGGDIVQIDTKGCISVNSGGTTQDGSGYTLVLLGGIPPYPYTVAETLYNPHGDAITSTLPSTTVSIADTNGNTVSKSLGGVYTDSLNQTALTATLGSLANPDTYSYTDVNSVTKTITVTKTTFTQKTVFGCAGVTDINGYTVYLPTSISFPDGSSMAFVYEQTPGIPADVTGRIQKITLPTGGTVTFGYTGANNGINCTDGTVPTLTRATSDGTWTYAHTPPAQTGATSTTTVTDPSGNATVYTFSGLYETQRQSYQGAVGGTLLQTMLTCYNNILTNCAAPTSPVAQPIVQKNVYTTIGSKTFQTAQFYDSYGQVTRQDDYDWLNGTYPLLKSTQILYAVAGSGACSSIGAYIFDRPCTVTVSSVSNTDTTLGWG